MVRCWAAGLQKEVTQKGLLGQIRGILRLSRTPKSMAEPSHTVEALRSAKGFYSFFPKTISQVPLPFISQKCTLAAQRHATLLAVPWDQGA